METNNKNTALLIMDLQGPMLKMLPDSIAFTGRVANAITRARNTGIPVIYVVVGFRPGMPELSRDNKGLKGAMERLAGIDMHDWMKIDGSVAPHEGELVITKRRVSAFTGSDLEVVLRAQGIRHIVLTGIATSGVVLSTLREAADKDFRITVLSDCCADADPEVHAVLTGKVFPRQADVMTSEEWGNTQASKAVES